MPSETVKITGLRELQRALKEVGGDLPRAIRAGLREAAEPVRSKAEDLASSRIKNIGPTWGRMKIGVTTNAVYVAPKSRRRGGSPRPNLGPLLMRDAMEPALAEEADTVVARIELLIDEVTARDW